ncbi:MAG: MotA/TolQ/ExbB proton channel family protein [Pseudomonadota bacterium]
MTAARALRASERWLLAALLIASASGAHGDAALLAGLRDDIAKSQRALDRETRDIGRAAAAQAQRVNAVNADVLRLRASAAAARRAADERTLSIGQLETRVRSWRAQAAYQANLLREFDSDAVDQPAQEVLANAIDRFETALAPSFARASYVRDDGQLTDGERLRLGPIAWYLDAEGGGLLLEREGDLPLAALPFSGGDLDALRALRRDGVASVQLDPTIRRVLAARGQRQGIVDHLRQGGIWVLPILGFACLAVLITLGKAWQFLRLPRIVTPPRVSGDADPWQQPAMQRWLGDLPPIGAEIVEIVRAAPTVEQRDDRLFGALVAERERLERFLGAIAVTATVAPLLGLLGTVSGMINTFSMMTLFGGNDPSVVSGGISEALVTTELGLIVAIPALVLHALLSRRASAHTGALEQTAVTLTDIDMVARRG